MAHLGGRAEHQVCHGSQAYEADAYTSSKGQLSVADTRPLRNGRHVNNVCCWIEDMHSYVVN